MTYVPREYQIQDSIFSFNYVSSNILQLSLFFLFVCTTAESTIVSTLRKSTNLNTFWNKCCRMAYGVTKWDHINTTRIHDELKTHPLDTICKSRQISYISHVLRMDDARPTKFILSSVLDNSTSVFNCRIKLYHMYITKFARDKSIKLAQCTLKGEINAKTFLNGH